MKDNPYSKIIEMMNKRGNQVTGMEIGQVISPSPLTIKVGDLQIGKGDIFVADYLLSNYSRSANISTIGTRELTFTSNLKQGDLLAVHPINNNQKYVVLARLVRI